jgi:glycosidase
LNWWKRGIIYQVYPRSFKDSDNNGIGDLRGITSKLDYLKNIGITAIWLNPIYSSGGKDAGYDIVSYRDIDQLYGTNQDFDNLVAESHKRGK